MFGLCRLNRAASCVDAFQSWRQLQSRTSTALLLWRHHPSDPTFRSAAAQPAHIGSLAVDTLRYVDGGGTESTAAPADPDQPHTPQGEKRCARCSEAFALRFFSPMAALPDGRSELCWGCRAEENQLRFRRARRRRDGGAPPAATSHPPTNAPQTCRTCGTRLPAQHFSVAAARKTGRMSACKACTAEADAARRAQAAARLQAEAAAGGGAQANGPRTCLECRETLPADMFYAEPTGRGGLSAVCKGCHKARSTAYRQARRPPRMSPPEHRKCRVCRELKPASEYVRESGTVHGLRSVCKACDAQAYLLRQASSRGTVRLQPQHRAGGSGSSLAA